MNELHTLEDLIAAGMPPHQVQAIEEGKGASFMGKVYTAESLGISAGGVAAHAETIGRLAEKDARIAELEAALNARAEAVGELVYPDVSLYEGFLPNSESEIKALSLTKLKALASIKGVEVEGEDKAAYHAALLKD